MTALTPGAWPWIAVALLFAAYIIAAAVGAWLHRQDMDDRRDLHDTLGWGPGEDDSTVTGGVWQNWEGE